MRETLRVVAGVVAAAVVAATPVALPVGADAATVVFVPPTGMPVPLPDSMVNAQNYYLGGTACEGAGTCDVVGISYPASFWPLSFLPRWCAVDCQKWDVSVQDGMTELALAMGAALAGTDDEVVLYGHSQGSAVISNTLAALASTLSDDDKARLQVVLSGNIDNPAGGLWSRLGFLGQIPFLDVTTGLPTPTDTGITFTSIIMEYDGVGDAPKYWGNPLAVLNAIAGFMYLHGSTLSPDKYSPSLPCQVPNCQTPGYYPSVQEYLDAVYDPANARQDEYGNTYIVVPSPTLPIVMPLLELASRTNTTALVRPFVDLISPVLRVLIDLGYDRTEDPGVYAPLSILPFSLRTNPLAVLDDLVQAVEQGIHDAVNGPDAPEQTTKTVAVETLSDTGKDAPDPALVEADVIQDDVVEDDVVQDDVVQDETPAADEESTDTEDPTDAPEATDESDETGTETVDDAEPAEEVEPAEDEAPETPATTEPDTEPASDTETSADSAAA